VTWLTRARAWRRAHPLVVDLVLAAVVLAIGLTGQPNPETGEPVPMTAPVIGLLVLACLALVVRRRSPIAVWLVTLAATAVSIAIVAGPAPAVITPMVAIYTIATLRRPAVAWLAAVVTPVVLLGTYAVVASGPSLVDESYSMVAVSAMACAIGFAVRSNRAIVTAAEERARVAEQTREDEAERRVTQERLRIARELHDVVAHHIAVINVQSGVARHLLETDPAAAAEALGHVREASGVVLTELSTILGLLRTSDEGGERQPAPGLAQVDALVESVRRSGTAVTMRTTGSRRELAPGTELAAYRLIQESLTNAGKHGAGSAEVAVEYRDDAVVIDVANPIPAGVLAAAESNGHGLVGMRERVASLGGRLEAGARADGRFVVHAELPVTAGAA
jgi:signal transduction histidine kinase